MTPTSDERFAEVFRQHYPRLVVLARRVLGDTGEAEDAAQEAMLALRTNAVSERSDDDIAAWLNRLVTNGSLNRLRGRRRAEVRAEVVAAREARSDGDGPGDAVIAGNDRERVRACLAVLPARQATALLLRHAGHRMALGTARARAPATATARSRPRSTWPKDRSAFFSPAASAPSAEPTRR